MPLPKILLLPLLRAKYIGVEVLCKYVNNDGAGYTSSLIIDEIKKVRVRISSADIEFEGGERVPFGGNSSSPTSIVEIGTREIVLYRKKKLKDLWELPESARSKYGHRLSIYDL